MVWRYDCRNPGDILVVLIPESEESSRDAVSSSPTLDMAQTRSTATSCLAVRWCSFTLRVSLQNQLNLSWKLTGRGVC
jgi:hypothetical protein